MYYCGILYGRRSALVNQAKKGHPSHVNMVRTGVGVRLTATVIFK